MLREGELEVGTARFPLKTTALFADEAQIVPLPSPVVFADRRRDHSDFTPVPARLSPSGIVCGAKSLNPSWVPQVT